MSDIRKAYANVSYSAMLRSWNYIECETSNPFETLGADALRAAFSGWAQAVHHDLGAHAQDSDSSADVFLALSPALTMGNSPRAFSPANALNSRPGHTNSRARCFCRCGCRRRPSRRLFCNLGDRGCHTPSDLDVVLILNPLQGAKKESVADVRRQTRRRSSL